MQRQMFGLCKFCNSHSGSHCLVLAGRKSNNDLCSACLVGAKHREPLLANCSAGAFASGTPTHFTNARGFDNSQSSADAGSNEDSYINRNGVYVSGNCKKEKKSETQTVAIHNCCSGPERDSDTSAFQGAQFDVISLHPPTRDPSIVTVTDHCSGSCTQVFDCEESR